MAPPPRKRAKTERVEEITFDDAARSEYLTGFHKRKQARIKHAQEQAAQREKEERIVQRKEVRFLASSSFFAEFCAPFFIPPVLRCFSIGQAARSHESSAGYFYQHRFVYKFGFQIHGRALR